MEYCSILGLRDAWKLKIDLVGDLQKYTYQLLVKKGYRDVDEKRALYQYFNLQKRQIECRKRRIHKSKEFVCPGGYESILKKFEEKVLNGESLFPYMSKKCKIASENDALLNDWNIYHFHLSDTFEKNGMAVRSDFQLFAFITQNDMYFIQIYKHKTPQLYCKQELLEIINNNWTELLEKFQLKDVMSVEAKFTDKEYAKIRKEHACSVVALSNKKVYGMIGGGYASDGSSIEAVNASDYWCNRLHGIEKMIRINLKIISDTINKVSSYHSTECDIKLLWIDNTNKMTMCERNNHIIIQINTKENKIRICNPWEVFGFASY